jgi:hypothetical protein
MGFIRKRNLGLNGLDTYTHAYKQEEGRNFHWYKYTKEKLKPNF